MSKCLRYSLVACAMLSLAACGKPVTQTPGFTSEELAAERQVHEAAVKAAGKGTEGTGMEVKGSTTDRNVQLNRLKTIADRISKASVPYCKALLPKESCLYQLGLDKADAPLNAYADGKKVVISPVMMDFAASDDELAVVIAHEMAHNILKHPSKTQSNATLGILGGTVLDVLLGSQGVSTGGQFGQLGAQAGVLTYSKDFERDADYLGIYIARAAGYNVSKAPTFWQKMSVENPQAVYIAQTHPSNPERSLIIRKTIEEINAKEKTGQPLMPKLRPVE